jgi:cobalt-zinc-cadmium efflux system membrane fusion protein
LVLPGRLVWNEEKTAKVYSPFSGRVESVEVQLGETVKKGQSLAHIQSPDFGVAQADARKAQAAAVLARSSLNRAKELYANGIIAKKEFSLNTPYDGVVVERNIYPGRELSSDLSNAPLLTITDPNNLWAILEASEVDLGRFEVGAEVVIHNNTLPNEKLTGKIIQIADFIDPVTRTLKVRVEVPNQNKKLRAEMFIQADIPVTNLEGIIVPARGIFLVGDQHFVFVELDINKYERHEVKVGKRFADKVEVIEGLKQEQKVVTEGNLYLQEILRANARSQKGKADQAPARLLDDVYQGMKN